MVYSEDILPHSINKSFVNTYYVIYITTLYIGYLVSLMQLRSKRKETVWHRLNMPYLTRTAPTFVLGKRMIDLLQLSRVESVDIAGFIEMINASPGPKES